MSTESPIDKIKAHFQAKLTGGLRSIVVPEWGITIYYGPETMEMRDNYIPLIGDKKSEGWAQVLLTRARNQDRTPMFSQADKLYLMKEADPTIVQRVAVAIFNDEEVTVDSAKKS